MSLRDMVPSNKHGNLLPQENVDKIMCQYHNRIERRCIEVGLTVDEEREWDSDDANVDVDALSESGEESDKHDSDDICFYSEDDDDDVDNIDLSSEELKQRHMEHYLQQCKSSSLPRSRMQRPILHLRCTRRDARSKRYVWAMFYCRGGAERCMEEVQIVPHATFFASTKSPSDMVSCRQDTAPSADHTRR